MFGFFRNNKTYSKLRPNKTMRIGFFWNIIFIILGVFGTILSIAPEFIHDSPLTNIPLLLRYIILAVSTTFFTNSLYNIFTFLDVSKDVYDETIQSLKSQNKELNLQNKINNYGLIDIFQDNHDAVLKIKSELNNISKIHAPNTEEYYFCDIICNGTVTGFISLESIRDNADGIQDSIIEYLKYGFSIRIIMQNYSLDYLAQLHIDSTFSLRRNDMINFESPISAYKEINANIKSLLTTFDTIMKHEKLRNQRNIGKIEIKFTNCIPALQYHRVGNKVFISSRMIGSEYISKPFINEYQDEKNDNNAFKHYKNFFDEIWGNNNFSWSDKNLSKYSYGNLPIKPTNLVINPSLVFGDGIISGIIKMTCNALVMILRIVDETKIESDAQPVRAFFTVINSNQNEKGVAIRYNLLAVDRREKDLSRDKIKSYEINSPHVMGEAVIREKIIFRTINEYEPTGSHVPDSEEDTKLKWTGKAGSNDAVAVSLSVPINANVEDENDLPDINYYEYYDSIFSHGKIKLTSKKSRTIAILTFEFHTSIKELFVKQENRKQNKDYYILKDSKKDNDNKKDEKQEAYYRILDEAKRCATLIIEYLGLDAKVGDLYIDS